jgi:hypothetical protein
MEKRSGSAQPHGRTHFVDGVWRVVGVGDGQVSDRPLTVTASALITPLFSRRQNGE